MSTLRTNALQTLDNLFTIQVKDLYSSGDAANSTDPTKGAAQIGRASQGVASIAALKALSTSGPSKYAQTSGYYSPGDGGGGLYYVPASFTGLVDNGGTIIQANDGGFWRLNFNGTVSVKQFGARGDGATPDQAAFQAAVNACKSVYMPSVVSGYKMTAGFTMSTGASVLFGDGPVTSSYFNLGGAGGHNFDVITINAFNVVIRDIAFQNFTTPAINASRFWTIRNDNSPGLKVLNVGTYGMHSGVLMGAVGSTSGGSASAIRNCVFSSLGRGTGIGIQQAGVAEVREITDVVMTGTGVGTVAANNARSGVEILGGVAITMNNVQAMGCGTPVRFNPPAGAAVNHTKITQLWCDSSNNNGLEIDGTLGSITDVQISDLWASGCTNGISMAGFAKDVVIHGLQCYQNASTGVLIAASANVPGLIISHAQISGNPGAGVSFGANVSGWKILSSNIGTSSFAGANAYGIFLNSGCDNYIIDDCDIRGNTTGQIAGHGGSTATKRVTNVIGYPTALNGTFTGTTDAAGLFSIPHGLGKTPLFVDMKAVAGGSAAVLTPQLTAVDGTNIGGKMFTGTTVLASTSVTIMWKVEF